MDGCIKNEKKHWLLGRYYGQHDYKPIKVWRFMYCSTDFHVSFECALCGAKTERSFVSWSELLHLGYTNEQIEKFN